MWYEKIMRRHLCDMHIDDWNPEFLSQFNPEKYFENLKTAKIQNAMLYFQSHTGLCYYPTKCGKMHEAFSGKETQMRRLAELCKSAGIFVTGYYSLIYNNWAHDTHPGWRMVDSSGRSKREANINSHSEFANNKVFRYGLCCPNNTDYRSFIAEQIHEITDFFTFDGMFFDMTFWPQMCYCESCKKRWENEVGGEIPQEENWNDPRWLLHIKKRREWIGEFASWVTKELKSRAPHSSVEHNFACAVLPDGKLAIAEPVNEACDYTGGDLYGGIYRQSFTCKFYRNITKNQPFEYMFSRCEPNLEKHTTRKSKDVMLSSVFLTAAHHGATLVIDAIDPCGTMDSRVYNQLGEVFSKEIPYEQYFEGEMIEDIGVYYSLKSKFNKHSEPYTNHLCAVNTIDNFIFNNIPCGVTGGYHDIKKYKILVASALTEEDSEDFERIIKYVEEGGNLYFSGGDCEDLLKSFFGAAITGHTREEIVYISPYKKYSACFDYFNESYPLHFDAGAPIADGIDRHDVIAAITLPYTPQDSEKFASIHSNPPGIKTNIPAIAAKQFGKGKVIWSALPIEAPEMYDYHRIFLNLLKSVFGYRPSFSSEAPKDVEITGFRTSDSIMLNAVLLNSDYKARTVESFPVWVNTKTKPKNVLLLPDGVKIDFSFDGETLSFNTQKLNIFDMYKIIL